MDLKKNIIYLSKEKDIICINGTYIDLNLIARIEDFGGQMILTDLNGKESVFKPEKTSFSYLNVPEKYSGRYSSTDIKKLIDELSSEFSYYHYYSNSYKIYNKIETDKKEKFNLIHWENLKNKILNRWIGVSDVDVKIVNQKVINLMEKYYNLNKDNIDVLENIKKLFGYDYNSILNYLNIEGDFYVNSKGEIIKI